MEQAGRSSEEVKFIQLQELQQQKPVDRELQQQKPVDRELQQHKPVGGDSDRDSGPKGSKKWKKWQEGWDFHRELATKDSRRWGQGELVRNDVDKKDLMDEADNQLQKALSHRHISGLKSLRNEEVNAMQNSLGKPKSRGWNNMKNPLNQITAGREKARRHMKLGLSELSKAHYPTESNGGHKPKPFGLGLGQDKRLQMDNALHGRLQEHNAAAMNQEGRQSSEMRHILGDFDMERYLSPQRMLKGQGDPMRAFQFNQVASDATPPDRPLRDYRDQR